MSRYTQAEDEEYEKALEAIPGIMASMGRAHRQHLIEIAVEVGYTREEAERIMSQPIHIHINGYCVACRGVCRE